MNQRTTSFYMHPSHGLAAAITRITEGNQDEQPYVRTSQDDQQPSTEYDTVACSLRFVSKYEPNSPKLFDQDNLPFDYECDDATVEEGGLAPSRNTTTLTPRVGDPSTDAAMQNPNYVAYLKRSQAAAADRTPENLQTRGISILLEIGGTALREQTNRPPEETLAQLHSNIVGALQEAPATPQD